MLIRKFAPLVFLALAACSVNVKNDVKFDNGPSSFRAAGGEAKVLLSWGELTGAASYRIYWNDRGGVTTSDQSMETPSTSYTHEGLVNGKTYYYRVCALASAGSESQMSEEVSATPFVKPGTPSGLTATAASGEVSLSWGAAANADYYLLYWNTTGGVTTAHDSIQVSGASYTHTGLTNGQAYYYRVAAANTWAQSDLSGEISSTPGTTGGISITPCNSVTGHSGSVWTTADCGPYSYTSGGGYFFNTSGAPSFASGRVSFKVTGLDAGALNSRDFFLFFAKMVTPSGKEGNFQIDLFNDGTNNARLISQRFDGTCSNFCEHHDISTGIGWDPGATYYFDIQWNSSTVSLTAMDAGSGQTVWTASVPTDGSYSGADSIGVGNPGNSAYSGINAAIIVSEMRLSVF